MNKISPCLPLQFGLPEDLPNRPRFFPLPNTPGMDYPSDPLYQLPSPRRLLDRRGLPMPPLFTNRLEGGCYCISLGPGPPSPKKSLTFSKLMGYVDGKGGYGLYCYWWYWFCLGPDLPWLGPRPGPPMLPMPGMPPGGWFQGTPLPPPGLVLGIGCTGQSDDYPIWCPYGKWLCWELTYRNWFLIDRDCEGWPRFGILKSKSRKFGGGPNGWKPWGGWLGGSLIGRLNRLLLF